MMVVSCENLPISKWRLMRVFKLPRSLWKDALIDFHIWTRNVNEKPGENSIE